MRYSGEGMVGRSAAARFMGNAHTRRTAARHASVDVSEDARAPAVLVGHAKPPPPIFSGETAFLVALVSASRVREVADHRKVMQ
jgi:hypothetical protein